MSTPASGRPHQDVSTLAIMTNLLRRVESATSRLEITPLEDSVIGTLGETSLNAFNASFFGATSLIAVHSHLMVFIQLLAKSVCQCISDRTPDGGLRIGVRPPAEQFLLGTQHLSELIQAIRDRRDPTSAPVHIAAPGWYLWRPVHSIVDSIELFIVGHEYAHLLMDHREPFFVATLPDKMTGQDVEHIADFFAQIVLLSDANATDLYLAVVSPLLFFKSLALMERDSILPYPKEHPASSERLAFLLESLAFLATTPAPRKILQDLLGVWSNIDGLLEEAWAVAMEHHKSRSTE
ncbi:MAG TPA: hypothetical protein VN643_07785 [Pyrinomonadaceae bacterium]|nr:hypothetical protein [Pyrinomonadaceae bacterium]